MAVNAIVPEVVKQKLEAFEQLEAEFEDCFSFTQAVIGQERFAAFPVDLSVYYLHALWVCECKDRLLSIYKNIRRYEGGYCLELLQKWQEAGDTASVISFLHRKLSVDVLSVAEVTRQFQETQLRGGDDGLARRLACGRFVLLNRGINLMQALNAIFILPVDELLNEVRVACTHYGHQPTQIARQLAEVDTSLYSYVPHQMLAQRNMVVMNKMGVNVMDKPEDQPGQRSWRVRVPTVPPGPYAQQVISGYLELITPWRNNIKNKNFVDRPEFSGVEEV